MTKQEVFEEYYDEIKDQLMSCTEEAMRSNGKVKFSIYASAKDGVQVLEDVSGGKEKLNGAGLYLITVIDYGSSFNPADYLPYDVDLDDEDDDDDYGDGEEWETAVDDDYIDQIMVETDWDGKMDEILDMMYYER